MDVVPVILDKLNETIELDDEEEADTTIEEEE